MRKLLIITFVLFVLYGCGDSPLRSRVEIYDIDPITKKRIGEPCSFTVWIWQIGDVEEIAKEKCHKD